MLATDSFLSEAFYEKISVLGRVDRGEYAEHCVERLDDLKLRGAWISSIFWIGYNLIMITVNDD